MKADIYKCACGYGWDKSKVVRHHFCPNCGRAVVSTELEPCTNAISRKAAIDGADAIIARDTSGNNDVMKAIIAWKSYVEGLPPVTPQYTNAEIQRMQELEQAEIQKAYELGKAELQPCEDCISRDKAIVQLNHLLSDWDDDWNVAIRKCIETIKNVPPAAPQPKMGHWIIVDKGLKVTSFKCSECGRIVRDDTGYDVAKDYPYCHCGAKMQEVKNDR